MNAYFDTIYGKLRGKLAAWFEGGVEMLPNLVLALLVVVVFALLGRLARAAVHRGLERWTDNEPVSQLVSSLVRVAVVLIGLFFALGLLHLDKTVTSLLAGVGVLGLALGFAFQDVASNLISGLFMAFRGHFAVGDVIEFKGHLGTVQSIELRATTLRTFQGLTVTVPNKDVFQNDVINYTRTNERRIDVPVGVAYSDNLPLAIEAIKAEVAEIDARDKSRPVDVFFTGFGASSIDLVVHVWLDLASQATFLQGRSETVMAIKRAVDKAGLTIPFPIRTLDFGAEQVGGSELGQRPLQIAPSDASPTAS